MQNPPIVRKLEVRYRDLDTLGHVNNAVYLEYFETVRFEYWRRIARIVGVTGLVSGDIPGAQYVVAETSVRFKAPILFEDSLFGAARAPTIGNRSYSMEFELRCGASFEEGRLVAEGSAAHVFYDPAKNEVQPRPDWFLPAAAQLEGRDEDSFEK